MVKALVIVESPAKAKTINKYLGRDFIVKSSVGHIRDLPTGGGAASTDSAERARSAAATRKMSDKEKASHRAKKAREQLVNRMGVDPEKGWAANYQILPGKEKVVADLRKAAASADEIYLATDLDREGEAIAWHLREAIGGKPDKYRRVVFNEITRSAIQEAFSRPSTIDMDRVNAQQARRFLDRVVGYMLSPLLWEKVARGLSAGRVQSVAVRLLVDREREIRAFVPEEFWELHAEVLTPAAEALRLELRREGEQNFRPDSREGAERAMAALRQARFVVSAREDKPTRTRPSAPFITSTLQQAASTRLGFSVKKTMTLAQRLYEAGHISYMRTDSTNLSAEAVAACREFIASKHGANYLPDKAVAYSSKSGAQEAHEAIRPSDVHLAPEMMADMERDAVRLYELIWRQFIACQMLPAEYLSSTLDVTAAGYELRARGRILKFDGFLRVLPAVVRKDEDIELPDVAVGVELKLQELVPSQHFTKAPARYTEATLVRELEKRGIGRPSTYASIISTIQERGYARIESRRLYAEKLGEIVTDRLAEKFTALMDYGFTAAMEESLDQVAGGQRGWKQVLDDFYGDFAGKLEAAKAGDGGMRGNMPVETGISCPKCGRPMQVRTGSTGVFLGCSGYALPPAERCKETINLVHGDEVVHDETGEDEEAESRALRTRHRCAICGTAMDSYLVDAQRKLHVCGNNPDCPGHEVETGRFKLKGYEGPLIPCDKCGADMQLKTGRFGKYFGCTSSECGNTRKLLRNGQAAPPKMPPIQMPDLKCRKVDDFYVLRDGASGLFLAASRFPKNRETRAPLVEELLAVRDQLDPKYAFILDAPVRDDAGNKTEVRYSRKTASQYVMSEVDGKPTGWRAHYRDGKWVVSKDA
jgi:DNA topoisomerase I